VNFLTEDQNGMSRILKAQWTITPTATPQPWIACATCGGPQPFKCSDRLRLNANGKKLDAWLIYRCSQCDKTWNRTLFERNNVRDIGPEAMAALQSNDPGWIRRHAFDVDALRHHARRIDEFGDVDIQKAGPYRADDWALLEIMLEITVPVSLRLDRMLCSELGVSRNRLQMLDQSGKLVVEPPRKARLKRSPADGMQVLLDLSDEPCRLTIGKLACGTAGG
jgi:hypothetical protein